MLGAVNAAWHLRRKKRQGFSLGSTKDLARHIAHLAQCPWLLGGSTSLEGRKERRNARAAPPPPTAPGAAIYRSDGASRGQGKDGAGSGAARWGAAFWIADAEGRTSGSPEAKARMPLGAKSNKVAEYKGIGGRSIGAKKKGAENFILMRETLRTTHPHRRITHPARSRIQNNRSCQSGPVGRLGDLD